MAGRARLALLGLLALLLAQTAVSVVWLSLNRDIFNALSAGDAAAFYTGTAKFAASLAVGVPIVVLYSYFRVRAT